MKENENVMLTLTEVLKGSVICKEPRKKKRKGNRQICFVTKSRYMKCSKHHNPDMILRLGGLPLGPSEGECAGLFLVVLQHQ